MRFRYGAAGVDPSHSRAGADDNAAEKPGAGACDDEQFVGIMR
jgi:hypothetical protein